MQAKRKILIVGGGTAGWLTAAYLARSLNIAGNSHIEITLLEARELGIIGVGEGAFPTIRSTLKFIGIDETAFIRRASAAFKQGVRFDDWLHAPTPEGVRHQYLHPFEAPFYAEDLNLVSYWLLQDPTTRPPFAEAVTLQSLVARDRRAPKRPGDEPFGGPLNYAYHFDANRLAALLGERAIELGVRHLEGLLTGVVLAGDGIAGVVTREHGMLQADLYIDCSGFRAELIGKALGAPFKSVKHQLFTDRALACKLPYETADAPIESFTVATAHKAGWTWDIGLENARHWLRLFERPYERCGSGAYAA